MEVVFHKVERRGGTISDMEKCTGKQCSKNTIQILMGAARNITVDSNILKKDAETVITACHTQGTIGEAHKSVLIKKADGMKILAGLFVKKEKKYEQAAMKIIDGVSEDKILNELVSYNVFISDQIKSEQERNKQILNMLMS